ncbi:unnamed protein product [Owenia fusiformis]|uniref:Uncharacterized protein n=1 Tax=Owenia fusiformis TaxID=6347 RepID=A0A8J1UCY2_OWEFU|nr:unnamed protein product [Owenia fusiformis]
MNMKHNIFALFVTLTLVGNGVGLKYRVCKLACDEMGLDKCSKLCRTTKGDAFIENSCWKDCSSCAVQSNAATVLREYIQYSNFDQIVSGHDGAEGPVFTKDGTFYMTALHDGQILTVDLQNKLASVFVEPIVGGFVGMPVGLQCDPENNIWVADARLGLLKVTPGGTLRQVATMDINNEISQGFNDLIFDYHGTLWISAPLGPIAPHNLTFSYEDPFGSVYCYNDATEELIKLTTGFLWPNGIAVQHDVDGTPKKLIFGESFNKNAPLWSYDIVGPCQIKNKQLWGNLPVNIISDGMDFDKEGNLIVAGYDGFLHVFGPNGGAPICRIKCPFTEASNVHFKPGTNELYITQDSSQGVWKMQWRAKGMEQYCDLGQI